MLLIEFVSVSRDAQGVGADCLQRNVPEAERLMCWPLRSRGRWGLFRRGFDGGRKTVGSLVDLFGAQAVQFRGMSARDRLKVLAPVPHQCH